MDDDVAAEERMSAFSAARKLAQAAMVETKMPRACAFAANFEPTVV